tara:strand:+ start:133 stop:411 length:279 start_codon:yes stop_codon:yes gene_type:complete
MFKSISEMTQQDINEYWADGYRPYEVYVCNPEPVVYCGVLEPAGSIGGWDIKHVFTKSDYLNSYPFFDTVIMFSNVGDCEEMFTPLSQIKLD